MPIVLRGWLRVLGERRWRMVCEKQTRDALEKDMKAIVADKQSVLGEGVQNLVSWLVLTEADETPTKGGQLKRQRPR